MQTILKTVLLLALFSVAALFYFRQQQAKGPLKAIVTAIATRNVYEISYMVGFAGTVSEQYLHFKQLLSTATDQQLTDLATNNKNAVVRLYAFQALKQKHSS